MLLKTFQYFCDTDFQEGGSLLAPFWLRHCLWLFVYGIIGGSSVR